MELRILHRHRERKLRIQLGGSLGGRESGGYNAIAALEKEKAADTTQ